MLLCPYLVSEHCLYTLCQKICFEGRVWTRVECSERAPFPLSVLAALQWIPRHQINLLAAALIPSIPLSMPKQQNKRSTPQKLTSFFDSQTVRVQQYGGDSAGTGTLHSDSSAEDTSSDSSTGKAIFCTSQLSQPITFRITA